MRNYAQEGWTTQLQGRRVVGHFYAAQRLRTAIGALRLLSLRNPLVPAGTNSARQRWVHIVSARSHITIDTADDNAGAVNFGIYTVDGFTVTDTTGGSAFTPTSLDQSGIASVLEGRGGASLSGGTLGTINPQITAAMASQPIATGGDAGKFGTSTWEAKYGPILIKGDQGFTMQTVAVSANTPLTVDTFGYVEWLETEKM